MILMVDDDKRFLKIYGDELDAAGYSHECINSVDQALVFLDKAKTRLEDPLALIVWDMMMPPGKAFAKEPTRGGLDTGLFFYRRVREEWPEIPTILFTNRDLGTIDNSLKEDARNHCYTKLDLLPSEFVETIGLLLGKPSFR